MALRAQNISGAFKKQAPGQKKEKNSHAKCLQGTVIVRVAASPHNLLFCTFNFADA